MDETCRLIMMIYVGITMVNMTAVTYLRCLRYGSHHNQKKKSSLPMICLTDKQRKLLFLEKSLRAIK